MKLSSFSLLILLFWYGTPLLQGQNLIEDKTELQVLVFEHLQKDKKRLISQGAMIRYKLRNAPKVWHRGELMAINNDHMVVDTEQVPFSDCLVIAGRVHSERGIIGGAAVGLGGTSFLFGTAFLGIPTLGVSLIAGGTAVLVTGIVLISQFQRFHLDKGWTVHAGTLSYSRGA